MSIREPHYLYPRKLPRGWAFQQRDRAYQPGKYLRTAKTPLIQLQSEWDADSIESAKLAHKRGEQQSAGLLWVWMLETSRLKAVLRKRVNALCILPFHMEPDGGKDASPEAKAVASLLEKWWEDLMPPELIRGILRTAIGMGSALCRVMWIDDGRFWRPKLTLWPEDAYYYRDAEQCWYARTRQGADVKITPGRGWFLWLPEGARGFQLGSVLSLSIPCLLVSNSDTDWNNYNGQNACTIRLAEVPRGASQTEKDLYMDNVEGLGRDTSTLMCPKNLDGSGFGMEQLDPPTGNLDTFERSQARQETKITIEILGQEKTTDDQGVGTYDAVEALQEVENDLVLGDGTGLARAYRVQVLRALCSFNWGHPEWAPTPTWGTEAGVDPKTQAEGDKATAEAATALEATLANTNKELDKIGYLERAGVPMKDRATPSVDAPSKTPASPPASDGQPLQSAAKGL